MFQASDVSATWRQHQLMAELSLYSDVVLCDALSRPSDAASTMKARRRSRVDDHVGRALPADVDILAKKPTVASIMLGIE